MRQRRWRRGAVQGLRLLRRIPSRQVHFEPSVLSIEYMICVGHRAGCGRWPSCVVEGSLGETVIYSRAAVGGYCPQAEMALP